MMIRTDLLVTSPCFLIGLSQVFTEAGIRIVATRTSTNEEPCWLADVAVIDADAVSSSDLDVIAETSRSMAVLILINDLANNHQMYLHAGAAGVINRGETGSGIIRAVELAITGTARRAAPSPAPASGMVTHTQVHSDRTSLSEREEQVLAQIAHGKTHGQIATRLGVSPHTVDTYVKRIRIKLGVGNKAELTRAALLGRFVTSTEGEATSAASGRSSAARTSSVCRCASANASAPSASINGEPPPSW